MSAAVEFQVTTKRKIERHDITEQIAKAAAELKAESGALLDQYLEDTRVRIGFYRVMRMHARHGRNEAPRFFANDARIDQKERLGVAVFGGCPDRFEVQARLGVRVE